MLVVAIPVVPCESLLALAHRSTDGTPSVLRSQALRATWGGRWPRQVLGTVVDVRRPGRINGVGVALHLEMARRCDGLPHADDRLPAARIGASPGFPPLRGDIARGAPASGCGRVAPAGPSRAPSPADVVACGARLATAPLTRRVGPPRRMGLRASMRGAGVCPAARFQRALPLARRACRRARRGVICRWAGLSWGRASVRRVGPKPSTPGERGVMPGFGDDRLTPRTASKALRRGRTVSSRTCREVAVTRQAAAPLTSWLGWPRRGQRLPGTTVASPSTPLGLTTGERMPSCGTPAGVAHRVPRSRQPRRHHVDRRRLCMGMGASLHAEVTRRR
jgi:hypothetical protein